jgi:DNA-binding CsgD family transcriptional regulator
VAERGKTTLALPDRDTVAGTVGFAKAAVAAGIRPVFGVDVAVAPLQPSTPGTPRAGQDTLVKDIVPEDFLHAVRVAARGDALLAPAITRKLIDRYVTQPPLTRAGCGLEELTSREREAVALAAQGLSIDEIADRLVISPLTAKTHINRAMAKLHARDRAQLVVLAYESGLVTPRNSSLSISAGRP